MGRKYILIKFIDNFFNDLEVILDFMFLSIEIYKKICSSIFPSYKSNKTYII